MDTINTIIKKLENEFLSSFFIFSIYKSSNSCIFRAHKFNDTNFEYHEISDTLLSEINEIILNSQIEYGIYHYSTADKVIYLNNDFNPELFFDDVIELSIYQRYGILPNEQDSLIRIQENLKHEKIKNTLAYACYRNKIQRIEEIISNKVSKSELNRKLKYTGTSLGLIIEHKNFSIAKKLLELGADPTKISLVSNPIELAFIHSDELVWHLFNHFKDDFVKIVERKGFSIAGQTTNIEIFKLLTTLDCDLVGKDPYMPMPHIFVDYNNLVGLKFLASNGVNMNIQSKYLKETAYERAIKHGKTEISSFLLQFQ